MKVKIKNKIYDSTEEPIMVLLSEDDKKRIARMPQNIDAYCMHPGDIPVEHIKNWMNQR